MKSTRSQRDVRLRQLLENRRREVEEGVRALREIPLQERGEVRDAPEQSVHDFAQDLELAVLQMKSETLALIEEARQRLLRGEYGRCTECGGPIAEARLGALPFARLCVACQRVKEEGRESLIRSVVDARVPVQQPWTRGRKRRAPGLDERKGEHFNVENHDGPGRFARPLAGRTGRGGRREDEEGHAEGNDLLG